MEGRAAGVGARGLCWLYERPTVGAQAYGEGWRTMDEHARRRTQRRRQTSRQTSRQAAGESSGRPWDCMANWTQAERDYWFMGPFDGGIPGLVRRIRRILDVSQRGLAALLGVSQSVVARWETGRTSPRMSVRGAAAADGAARG